MKDLLKCILLALMILIAGYLLLIATQIKNDPGLVGRWKAKFDKEYLIEIKK